MRPQAAALKTLLDEPGLQIMPGCGDAMGARLIEEAGFGTGFVSGSSIAAMRLAMPDMDLLTFPEMADAVETAIAKQQPELVLGTQMERHIAKRLGIPCAVISSPVHVQDFPARYSPQMGFEGANVIFDTWIHPLMMGLEEHLLSMFREDFEFHNGAAPSHLGVTHGASPDAAEQAPPAAIALSAEARAVAWTFEAESELRKIPFFVRGKAKRNTERFAGERGVATITVETLYDAKAHYGR